MKKKFANVALALLAASAISIGCGDDDDSSNSNGGTSGSAGANSAGKGGTTGTSGTSNGGTSNGGTSNGGTSNGGTSNGGKAGSGGGGKGGSSGSGGTAGGDVGGAPLGGGESGGAGGVAGDAGAAGAAGAGGADSIYTPEMVARGTLIVRNMALCGGCHTASGGQELGGNPQFKNGALPAPNLTPDPTGIGDWSDAQIITAFRDGVDDQGRHLDPAMPYWLFHNMSDDDALDVVAFLRSLPPKSGAVGEANVDATPVTPLTPASFPNSSLQAADAGYAEAQMGKYLVSGVAQCVKCHSPSTAGLPSGSFLSGATPPNNTTIFASNLTPDATGLTGWTAADVATALKAGTNKAGATLCGSMPAAAKGYGGMTDADAHAIGVYLTTIPAVANAASAPSLEPACP